LRLVSQALARLALQIQANCERRRIRPVSWGKDKTCDINQLFQAYQLAINKAV
jgi:hypothetical protein